MEENHPAPLDTTALILSARFAAATNAAAAAAPVLAP
jgi:hypothetical protein